MPAYSELKRRLGFEYNGMVLHEYYFGNLKKAAGSAPAQSPFAQAGSQLRELRAVEGRLCRSRKNARGGVGYLLSNPLNGQLSNHWVTLHETGNVAGFMPVLVMDVWEHAFLLDYKPAERAKYIDAFFANVDWKVIEDRLHKVHQKVQRARAA